MQTTPAAEDENHEKLVEALRKLSYAEALVIYTEIEHRPWPFNHTEFETRTGWNFTELRAEWFRRH